LVVRCRELTREEYEAGSSTVAHFYYKLLRLRGMMKTRAGRARAERRHAVMEGFLHTLFEEVEGRA